MRGRLQSSLQRLGFSLIAVMLCVILAQPAQALTANVPTRLPAPSTETAPVTDETAYTGVLLVVVNPHTGLFAENDPIDRIDPTGQQTEVEALSGLATQTTLASLPGVTATPLKWGGVCTPHAKAIIQGAVQDACAKINSTEFGICMDGPGGRAPSARYVTPLRILCDRGFNVKCDSVYVSRGIGVPTRVDRNACAWGDPRTQTVTVYDRFFSSDQCGYGWPCIMAHEMLHLLGPRHPLNHIRDRLFIRLHRCMGAPDYENP